MIEFCHKYNKLDDAWLIFKNINEKLDSTIFRICEVVLSAIESNRILWFERLKTVINCGFETQDENTCSSLTRKVINKLYIFNTQEKTELLNIFKDKIAFGERSRKDYLVCTFLKGVDDCCHVKENSDVYEVCFRHASVIFEMWFSNKKYLFFFVDTPTPIFSDIFFYMLDLCCECKKSPIFFKVCSEMKNSKTEITKEIIDVLNKFHNNMSCNCSIFKKIHRDKKFQREVLKHTIDDLPSLC